MTFASGLPVYGWPDGNSLFMNLIAPAWMNFRQQVYKEGSVAAARAQHDQLPAVPLIIHNINTVFF